MISNLVSRSFATKIGVLGAGQMGTGIGIVSSRIAQYNVVYVDPNANQLKKSEDFCVNWAAKEVKKEKMTAQDQQDCMQRLQWSSELQVLKDCDLVVEAVNENFELKKQIFQQVAKVTPDHAILASNTSSISISKIAGTIPDRAHQVIGMHFMNPVPVMKLVEVIRGLQTDDATH